MAMPSRAKSSPSRAATSRPAGSVPKRAPQKTQTEEGTGFDTSFLHGPRTILLFTDDPTPSRTEATWYHFAEEGGAAHWGAGSRTVGRVMSRTVIWLVVGGAIVIAAGLGVAWQVRMSEQAVLDRATKPTVAVPQATPSTASSAPPPAAASPAVPATPAPPTVAVPTFDIARISPDGRAVIAGRAYPGAKIVLLDGGKEIARGEADARGEWVVIAQDPP